MTTPEATTPEATPAAATPAERPRTGQRRPARARNMVLAAIIGAAFVGYFVGLGGGTPRPDGTGIGLRPPAHAPGEQQAPPAMTYADIGQRPSVANPPSTESWDERVAKLRATPVAEPVLDEAAKLLSLEKRAAGRAFNGAPPVIPHAAKGLSDASCNICHGRDLSPGKGLARRPPHDHYTQCTQCHVVPAPPFLDGAPIGVTGANLARTSFVGAPAPTSGARAWKGAPPVVPHTTWMRGDCTSCHGPSGWPGIQTSHPERQSCLQCHGSGAVLEQAPAADEPPAFLPGPKIVAK